MRDYDYHTGMIERCEKMIDTSLTSSHLSSTLNYLTLYRESMGDNLINTIFVKKLDKLSNKLINKKRKLDE